MAERLGYKFQFWIYLVGVVVGILFVLIYKQLPSSCLSERFPGESIPKNHPSNDTEPLFSKVKILCWVMTSPNNLEKRAKHAKETWWKRCNVGLFVSSKADKNFPAIGINAREGHGFLYEKTIAGHRYLWEHHRNDADWFLKADDDTYVVLENLRLFLKDKNPEDPVYYRRKFKTNVKQGYMSGGAGYILSREALKRYVAGLYLEPRACSQTPWYQIEDVLIGKCLEKMGVKAGDSRDSELKEVFYPLEIEHHTGSIRNQAFDIDFNPTCPGINCTSRWPASFHHIVPERLYMLDYLFYKVEVNGRCEKGYTQT